MHYSNIRKKLLHHRLTGPCSQSRRTIPAVQFGSEELCTQLVQFGLEMAEQIVPNVPEDIEGKPQRKEKGRCVSYNLSGLALGWDNTSSIRQRMREGNNLLQHFDTKLKMFTNNYVERNVKNVRVNAAVLDLVCVMTQKHGLLPNIDKLAEEVKSLYRLNQRPVTISTAYDQGWAIRGLIQVLKGQVKSRRVKQKSGEHEKVFSWPKDLNQIKFID